MKTITQSMCGVIPSYMLSRIGSTDQGDDARATLQLTRELASRRAQSLIHEAAPRPKEVHKQCNVHDAQGGDVLPGPLVVSEDAPDGGDPVARQAFDATSAFWDLLRLFGRNSLDRRGYPLDVTVHYGTRFQNAIWNGAQVVCGDGDGLHFTSFTTPDIIGHEFGHGIAQFNSGMNYYGETGAVNEHLADVAGTLVKQYLLGQTVDQADWLIGAGVLGPGIKGQGLRSLAAPGTAYADDRLGRDRQPSHVKDYVETTEDNGGVHINSGILNHAFYRACMARGGRSWEGVGRIWFHTMVEGLPNQPTFFDLAVNTVAMAGELYGPGSGYDWIIADAWAQVGIIVALDDVTNGRPSPWPLGATPRPRWRQSPARRSSRPSDKRNRNK